MGQELEGSDEFAGFRELGIGSGGGVNSSVSAMSPGSSSPWSEPKADRFISADIDLSDLKIGSFLSSSSCSFFEFGPMPILSSTGRKSSDISRMVLMTWLPFSSDNGIDVAGTASFFFLFCAVLMWFLYAATRFFSSPITSANALATLPIASSGFGCSGYGSPFFGLGCSFFGSSSAGWHVAWITRAVTSSITFSAAIASLIAWTAAFVAERTSVGSMPRV
jgi:hypothetical protein